MLPLRTIIWFLKRCLSLQLALAKACLLLLFPNFNQTLGQVKLLLLPKVQPYIDTLRVIAIR